MLPPSFVHASLALALVVAPLGASAQPAPPRTGEGPPAATDVARTQFEAGVAEMAQSRWQQAADAFEASMRARATASAALNLGISLKNLGRLLEARVRLQQFMEMASPQQHTQHDGTVQPLLQQIARDLGRVHLLAVTPATAALSVDNRRVQPNEAGEVVVDPGAHTVRAEAAGFVPFEERVELAAGGTRDLRVEMVAAPSVVAPVAAPVERVVVVNRPVPAAPVARPLYQQWWFWTIIGGVVAAGAVTGVVIATRDDVRDPPPTSTNINLSAVTSLGGAP